MWKQRFRKQKPSSIASSQFWHSNVCFTLLSMSSLHGRINFNFNLTHVSNLLIQARSHVNIKLENLNWLIMKSCTCPQSIVSLVLMFFECVFVLQTFIFIMDIEFEFYTWSNNCLWLQFMDIEGEADWEFKYI